MTRGPRSPLAQLATVELEQDFVFEGVFIQYKKALVRQPLQSRLLKY